MVMSEGDIRGLMGLQLVSCDLAFYLHLNKTNFHTCWNQKDGVNPTPIVFPSIGPDSDDWDNPELSQAMIIVLFI